MMHNRTTWTVKIAERIVDVEPQEWDACANPSAASGTAFNPFTSHAFLHALEASQSATAETGWAPHHLLIEDGQGTVHGAIPLYLKSHSYGEYVFDHGWAEAYIRAGGRYYPKLQASVPFTPATGRRLLVRPGPHEETVRTRLINALKALTRDNGLSSLHITFLPQDEWRLLGESGFLQRTDRQFHWHNRGYTTFDDFLGDLSSRKRKTVRKERRTAVANDITIERLTGDDLTEAHWDAFFAFYIDTGMRKWGRPYLTREFFSHVSNNLRDHILLVMCRRGGRYIAGALNFIGGDTLYGRNWGCIEDHPFLHFEACYYQAIEFAIERGLSTVEAGAQGAHKLARGYVPVQTYSAHYLPDPGFEEAVRDYLEEERRYIESDITVLARHAPFRHSSTEED